MIVYFLPGIFGSELYAQRFFGNQTTWISIPLLALQGYRTLELSPDGESAPPGFKDQFPGPPLSDYYSDAIGSLANQLEGTGWEVRPWGYDWRKDIFQSGDFLANDIRANVDRDGGCVIIGHSMGGLVARMAWWHLTRVMQQNRIKRIITLGTPHWGSYAAPLIFSSGHPEFAYVEAYATFLFTLTVTPGVLNPFASAPTRDELVRMMATWPGLYQLFPSLYAPDVQKDPLRANLYDNTNYIPERRISNHWLLEAQRLHKFLAGPDSIPPPGRLTCVAGDTGPMVSALGRTTALLDNQGWIVSGPSDGKVLQSSALMPNCVSYITVASHIYIPAQVAASGLLAKEVLAERPDNMATPEPATTPAPLGWFRIIPDLLAGLPAGPFREFCPKGTRIR